MQRELWLIRFGTFHAQKLLSAGHSGISHNQDINGFAFSGADDGRCRITVDDGEGMTALSGDLLHKMSQFVIGGSGPCLLGFAEFGGGGVLRKDDCTTNSSAP